MPLTEEITPAPVVPVLSNTEVVPEFFRLAFEAPHIAAKARPGQFLMLSLPSLRDPLLPRPFAVFLVEEQRVEILYRRVGKGTGLLSRVREGEPVRVLGPLGNGFVLPDPAAKSIIVAGGCGIASVHFLLLNLLKRPSASTALLYGVRSHQEIIPLEPLEKRGLLVRIATEDGRRGLKGTVTDLLSTFLEHLAPLSETLVESFVCGPLPMLRAVAAQMNRLGIKAQFSLESRMACGYGVCQGCVLPFKAGEVPGTIRYRKVCAEGPVFSPEEVCWDAIPES